MTIFSRLFRGGIDIPHAAPAPVDPTRLQNLEYMLEAGDRVGKHLGIQVNGQHARNALVAVRSQTQLATALEQREIAIMDFAAVRRYQALRVRRTILETVSQGWNKIYGWTKKRLLHGWSGVTSATLALLVTLPFGLPLVIDTLWYDVAPWKSYFAVLMPQVIVLGIGFLVLGNDEPALNAWVRFAGRFYARANYFLLGWPAMLIATLTASWFMGGKSGRRWRTLSASKFLGKHTELSEPVIMMDRVIHAVPGAKLQFEALENADGTRDGEAFLVVDVDGYEDDKLHVWHGRL